LKYEINALKSTDLTKAFYRQFAMSFGVAELKTQGIEFCTFVQREFALKIGKLKCVNLTNILF